MEELGQCEIDLFASRINYKLRNYISWRPDPGASAIDAFMFDWNHTKLYIFPPFRFLGKILKRISLEKVQAVIIMPFNIANKLASQVIRLLIDYPFLLPYQSLYLPQDLSITHPLGTKLRLIACSLSSLPGKNREFLNQLETSYHIVGDRALRHNTNLSLRNGNFSVQIRKLTP